MNFNELTNVSAMVIMSGLFIFLLTKFIPSTLEKYSENIAKARQEYVAELERARNEFLSEIRCSRTEYLDSEERSRAQFIEGTTRVTNELKELATLFDKRYADVMLRCGLRSRDE